VLINQTFPVNLDARFHKVVTAAKLPATHQVCIGSGHAKGTTGSSREHVAIYAVTAIVIAKNSIP